MNTKTRIIIEFEPKQGENWSDKNTVVLSKDTSLEDLLRATSYLSCFVISLATEKGICKSYEEGIDGFMDEIKNLTKNVNKISFHGFHEMN